MTSPSHGLEKHVVLLFALAALLLSGCGAGPERSKAAFGPSDARGGAQVSTGGHAVRDSEEMADAPASAPAPAPPAEAAPGRNEFGAPPAPPPPPPKADKKGEPAKEQPKAADGTEAPHETSMLIYTARVTMAVYQVEQGLLAVEKVAKENGGYLSLKHDREIVIRIPRNRFEPALAIEGVGSAICLGVAQRIQLEQAVQCMDLHQARRRQRFRLDRRPGCLHMNPARHRRRRRATGQPDRRQPELSLEAPW